MELPPSSKKLSRTPTLSTPSSSLQISASCSSSRFLGPSYSSSPSSLQAAFGSLPRSSFPLSVSGISSISTHALGTIASGSLLRSCSASSLTLSLTPASPTTYPTSLFPPSSLSAATTAHPITPPSSLRAASTSPISTLCPLTFTCPSRLPWYSSPPPSRLLPTSPLRYLRLPASPLGSGTNLSAVSPGFPRYPLATPAPPITSSPLIPLATSRPLSSHTSTLTFSIASPIPGSPSPASHSSLVAQIVPSVGPYRFRNLLPLPHSLTSLPGHSSPATVSSLSSGISSASTAPSTVGDSTAAVTLPSLISPFSSSPDSSPPLLPTFTDAPLPSAIAISNTDASKLIDANCSTRSPSPSPNLLLCASTTFASPPCSTITPFGLPVDPDV